MKILKLKFVLEKTGLCRSNMYKLVKSGDFPAPIKLGKGTTAVGWVESEIECWLNACVAARDAEVGGAL